MISEKICRKCEKQFPSTTIFCPECGSMTMAPEKPAPPPSDRPRRVQPRPVPFVQPVRTEPVKVRAEHSRNDFFEGLVKNDVPGEDVETIRQLMSWSEGLADLTTFGDTVAEGGRVGYRSKIRVQEKTISLFWVGAEGRVEIDFEDWIHVPPFDSREKRLEMLKRLNSIKGVKIAEDKIAAHPPMPVRALRDKAERDKFVEAFEWFVGLVRPDKG